MKLIVWPGADVQFFGIDWVGINPENGRKLVLSAVFAIAILTTSGLVRWLVGRVATVPEMEGAVTCQTLR